MSLAPPSRRGIAAAAGGVLVLGSGMSVGVLAADMQHDWAGAEVLRHQAAVLTAARAEAPKPVIVVRTKVRHITPEPVVVRKKVYRTVRGSAPAPTQPRRSTGGSTTRTSKPSSGSRTVVAPAPAPAPAPVKAPAATTSKTS